MKKRIIILFRMKNIFILSFTAITFMINAQENNFNNKFNLMPYPKKIVESTGVFRIDTSFVVSISGSAGNRVYKYATRLLRRLSDRTGIFFTQGILTSSNNPSGGSLELNIKREANIRLKENESYSLIIFPDKIKIFAETDLGAMHSLETLLQLLSSDMMGYYFPSVKIDDEPRFPWRGLLIDVCRHFMPIEVIKRNLDGMAAVKLNVLHLHLSEDQGFRVESKVFPLLHQLGSDGNYYTQEQIEEIISYADERGIRIVPEFDMPGHTTSWFVGYPELASQPGPYEIERNWGVMDPVMNPTLETTYQFLDKFFAEMTLLFTDEYFHIGGDENNGKQWSENPQIKYFMKENNIADFHALQTYFNKRVLSLLSKYNKKMIGWDEILQPDMPKNIVIQSWRGKEALKQAAQNGYMGILSNGYYIDLIQPAAFHYLNDPIEKNSSLSNTEKLNILGGEATMWSELVTPENIDSRIWPRTAAIAERLWSPSSINDVDDMYNRLETINFQLEELGLTQLKNYDMMLRRLTNGGEISNLKTLVDVLEPVKLYARHSMGIHYTSFSPYSRVVDAAKPDSKTARVFNKLVDEFLKNKNSINNSLFTLLNIWKLNHDNLKQTISQSPVLWEIEPHSSNLSKLANIALTAIDLLKEDESADKNWMNESKNILQESKKPFAQVELMIVNPIEKLLDELMSLNKD